jgi:hypothetical protein
MQVSPLSPTHRTSFPSIASSIPAPYINGNVTLLHLRVRELVNRELRDLKGQRGVGLRVPKTGDGEPLLVDATVRFFNESIVEE